MPENVQTMTPALLLQELRDLSRKLGQEPDDKKTAARCDMLEEEIQRRMAW